MDQKHTQNPVGPIIALVLILTLLIIGAVYYFQKELEARGASQDGVASHYITDDI